MVIQRILQRKMNYFVNITNLVAITPPQPFGCARPCLDNFISQLIDCRIAECRSFSNVMRFSKVEEVEYFGYFEENMPDIKAEVLAHELLALQAAIGFTLGYKTFSNLHLFLALIRYDRYGQDEISK